MAIYMVLSCDSSWPLTDLSTSRLESIGAMERHYFSPFSSVCLTCVIMDKDVHSSSVIVSALSSCRGFPDYIHYMCST